MKTTLRTVTVMATLQASSAFAANGALDGGIGLAGWVFIGFMALIITFQAIPALIMFGSMMAAIFGKSKNLEEVTENGKAGNS